MASHPREPKPKACKALKDPTLKAPDSAPAQRIRQARDEASTEAENTPRAGAEARAPISDE